MENSRYNWDVAISLCKQDVDFAKKLVKFLNPTLKIFFYEDRQEELICKSGPEEFARIFKEQSRVVVILSREEWSNSYYTDIEKNAIIARTAVRNQGYHFLIIIPMVQGEIPSWYPPTNIYLSPFRFSIEDLAHFIEFKVAEEGGELKTLNFEDRYQILIDRINEKKSIISLQSSDEALQYGKKEIDVLKNCFNSKSDFLRKNIIDSIDWLAFSENVNISFIGYGVFKLQCEFLDNYQLRSTQEIIVQFKLMKKYGSVFEILMDEERVFFYSPNLQGWSLRKFHEGITGIEAKVLYRHRNHNYYDLTNPIKTDTLVDKWFQKLLAQATAIIERHL